MERTHELGEIGCPSGTLVVLSMGFSNRYGRRDGLGRFGVGLKLAGLSLGKRIDVYIRKSGDDTIRHAYLDLQEIKEKL
ncbi:ATP-binding protein [Embleya sp. AB8]|uniref:ATP-binding protein n=1 Tax=Embleya sp. AB8 TaxID=3156304 RepID=UPI003C75168A